MIKAVIFDCFGVLTADNWQEFLNSLPTSANIEQARQAHRAYDSGQISKAECSDRIYKATGKYFTEIDDATKGGISKNKQLLSYIQELHDQGYKISLLSNAASNWIREQFLDDEEQSFFDDFLLSYEIGLIKPEPKMFSLATSRLKVKPEEAVLVDDKERYCQAAQLLGMKTILYQNFEQTKHNLKQILASND